MSADIADRLLMVSSSDSPLLVDEALMFRFSTSADSRLAAISKVVRVRVEFSKNRLNTLLPRSSGTFLTSRSESDSDTNWLAVSRMCVIMSRDSPSMDSRCLSSPFLVSCGLRNVLVMGEAWAGAVWLGTGARVLVLALARACVLVLLR